MTSERGTQYRNALMWAVDYFSVDGMTEKERVHGVKELGKVLLGRQSRAATYEPDEWSDSVKLTAGGHGEIERGSKE